MNQYTCPKCGVVLGSTGTLHVCTETPKTVRVRIAVAVDSDGHWNASGWMGASDEDVLGIVYDALVEYGHTQGVVWVEADVPLPVEQVIEGTVRT